MSDQLIGGIENMTERAVILLKFNEVANLKVSLKISHIANVRTSEGVNRLVIIAHSKHAVAVKLTNTGRRKASEKL